MAKCPACGSMLSKPMEDESAECFCGWSVIRHNECPECDNFVADDDFNVKEQLCESCVEKWEQRQAAQQSPVFGPLAAAIGEHNKAQAEAYQEVKERKEGL